MSVKSAQRADIRPPEPRVRILRRSRGMFCNTEGGRPATVLRLRSLFGAPSRSAAGAVSKTRRCELPTVIGASTGWYVGLALGIVVVLVAAAIVITIVVLAQRIAKQAGSAVEGVEKVREQTTGLGGVGQINDSGIRILHSARALRKVAVGK